MPAKPAAPKRQIEKPKSFQEIILKLSNYWSERGCAILQPYDMEVGAATLPPATTLRALGPKPWHAAYPQPSRRPKDFQRTALLARLLALVVYVDRQSSRR